MNKLVSQIIKTGLVVGTLDILAAFIYYFIKTGNTNFFVILQFIASGAFGQKAFSGGDKMNIYGLIFHYIIAFAFTIFFFWLFPKLKILGKNKILTGIVYGVFIWLLMNLIVVPLSNIGSRPFNTAGVFIGAFILIVCIGIPLSFMANAFYKKKMYL